MRNAEVYKVDEKIASPLGRVRGIIRRYVTIEGVLSAMLFVVAWFWVAMLLDYGVFRLFGHDWALDAPKFLRGVALAVASFLLVGLLVRMIAMRLLREFSDSSVALVLEKRFPDILGDRLITAVQLCDLNKAREYGYSTDMIQKTVNDVRARMDDVPVNTVFDWKRLWRRTGALVLLSVGLFAALGAMVFLIGKRTPAQFLNDFSDTSVTLIERDVLLQNTPWPRRAYLEVVDFPGDELRIGRDASAPKVRVAAFQYVIADSKAAVGWRPMTWADPVGSAEVPELPLQPIRDARAAVDVGPFVFGSAHPFTAPNLPEDLQVLPEGAANWSVDRVEQVFVLNEDVQKLLGDKYASALSAIKARMAAIESATTDSANSRRYRKLAIPDEVSLRYRGVKTRVDMTLRGEANNTFSGTLADLKESIRFTARGADYTTPEKRITLVPPPMLQELKRDEYHPAYLYHKAPFADAEDLKESPEQKPYLASPTKLKGLRQVLRDQAVSLTGDKSRFDVPMGAEFVLKGRSDKPLVAASILPKAGKFPGIDADVQDPPAIPLPIGDGHDISFEFSAATKKLVTRQTEFEIFLKDTDGVSSKRLIQIMVEEDKAPEIDVVVDVIRKVGSTYLCTPQALIPFTKESKVRDDRGLNRVEFSFGYTEIEPMAVTIKRLEMAMWYWNSAPVLPTLGDPIYRLAALGATLPVVRPPTSAFNDRVPLPAFTDEYRKRLQTVAEIKAKLDGPRPTGPDLNVINIVDFRGIEDELKLLPDGDVRYGFDIRKIAPGLRRANENEAQRSYLLNLNVVAVDTNVETDKPGMGQSKEVLVFKLVGDGELLTEIAKEEANLADKLDDAIRRMAETQSKLRALGDRLPGNTMPEQFVADQTRSNELIEQMGKAKDVTAEIGADYQRILQEFRINRLPDHLIKPMEQKVVFRLRDCLTKEFPEAEQAYGTFHSELSQSKAPAAEVVFSAQQKVGTVLNTLREIRGGIGQGLDLKRVISQIEGIIKDTTLVRAALDDMEKRKQGELSWLVIKPAAAAITIQAGQKATVRVPIDIGPFYAGNFTVKVDPSSGSELTVVKEVKLKDEDREVVLEVSAGQARGNHTIRLTPDSGPAVDVRLIVK